MFLAQNSGFLTIAATPLHMVCRLAKKVVDTGLQVGGIFVVGVGSAMAAVPTTVTTAITDAGTDAATLGAAILVVIVGIFSFKLLRKSL